MVSIIDYGAGNLRSVYNAFEYLGVKAVVVDNAGDIKSAERLILPGVGSSREAVSMLRKNGMVEPILEKISRGIPFLGICLGMQLLFESSEESGTTDCLGLIRGQVKRFSREGGIKVPQIGWNSVRQQGESPLFEGIDDEAYFYFVHSYYCPLPADGFVTGVTQYGLEYASALQKGNLFAVQFHPERSQRDGLRMLRNFSRI